MLLEVLEILQRHGIQMSAFSYCEGTLTLVLTKGLMKMSYMFSPTAHACNSQCEHEIHSALLRFVAEYTAIRGEGDDQRDQEG